MNDLFDDAEFLDAIDLGLLGNEFFFKTIHYGSIFLSSNLPFL
jgi:hypothetical protein